MLRTEIGKGSGGAWWRSRARRVHCAGLAVLAALAGGPAAAQPASEWARAPAPLPGGAEAIGRYNAGCLVGGVALPDRGAGFQLTETRRNRRFAHPDMAAYVADLGARVAAAGLGHLTVEDVAQPRGGPMPSGHRSHQMGLDVDIWYRLGAPPSPAEAEQWYMVPRGRQ
ncbi:MAG: penicillin-insensitive murein endopeptidase, partial [Alphaproteobacteria bacterium]